MPPVLDPKASKVDGLAFLGLSLARKHETLGHPNSQTHQTAFDLNEVIDREYEHVFSTNDDGWLVGGGEPPESYKLSAPDSAHVEIMRIGTYEPSWGGVSEENIIKALQSGKILIPEMIVLPTGVVANQDDPPELEIRFDMENQTGQDLPLNWQLRFLHNQLFRYFEFPSRFCPGAFHSTIVRKAEFRSSEAKFDYFAKCFRAIQKWKAKGPQPLIATELAPSIVRVKQDGSTTLPIDSALNQVAACNFVPLMDVVDEMLTPVPESAIKRQEDLKVDSGIYLFRDRNTITHYFEPNFCAPWTPEKKAIIDKVLAEQWDEPTLSWKAADPIKENDGLVDLATLVRQ